MTVRAFAVIFLCVSLLPAQQHARDSDTYSPSFRSLIDGGGLLGTEDDARKCGFSLMAEIISHWNGLTELQRAHISAELRAPVMQSSTISPAGYFRIHYDILGTHAVDPTDLGGNGIPDYIDSVGAIFDYVWEFEINVLGYDPPGTTVMAGKTVQTEPYNVYVRNLGTQYYGYTAWNQSDNTDRGTAAPTYNTYIVINTSYSGFYTSGLDAVRVTAAHEFHHAIQLATYGFWPSEVFFYEITSTWLEDVVYPGVNDYYQYLPSVYAANVHTSPFYDNSIRMYGRALWGQMMQLRYGSDIMKRKWELIRRMSPLEAIRAALGERGASFGQELAEFYLWLFHSGNRSKEDRYFPKSAEYPTLQEKSPTIVLDGETIISGSGIRPQTIHFHSMVTASLDTVYLMITNLNPSKNSNDQSFSVTVTEDAASVGAGLTYRLAADTLSYWRLQTFAGSETVAMPGVILYPNPFVISRSPSLAFVVEQSVEPVELYIYTASMRLVGREFYTPVELSGRMVIRWDGRDRDGLYVASGIYIYVLKIGDELTQGKFTVIRN